MHTTLIDLVRDPSLIPHVYDYCDQWCRYCRAAPRCLLYRTSGLRAKHAAPDDAERLMADGLAWARAVADAAQTEVAHLDVELSSPTFEPPPGIVGGRLERLGRNYMILANVFLQSADGGDVALSAECEATPLNVVSWLHMTIASKIFRALVSQYKAAQGQAALTDDASASAKLVLVSIDRSREALDALEAMQPADARIAGLGDYLGMLAVAVEKRFPEARGFVRPGLDEA